MRQMYLIIILCTISVLVAKAQPYNFPPLKGYKIVSKYPVYVPDNLWDFIDGAADGYISYGFQNVHVREYVKGKNVIKVEIYRHKDRDNTFGIYASERSPSYRHINLGAQGYVAGGVINFFKDCYYVKLRTFTENEKVLRDLESLAYRVADMLPGDPSMPRTLTEFPQNFKEKNTETYINESVLGHDFLKGAYRADYKQEGITYQVYIFDKNSREDAFQTVKSYLALAGLEPDDSAEGKYVFKDGYNGNIFLAWKENRIVIITGLEKDQTNIADRITGEILR